MLPIWLGDARKYSGAVSLDLIEENDCNLSVTRYIDIFDEEPEVDIPAALQRYCSRSWSVIFSDVSFFCRMSFS